MMSFTVENSQTFSCRRDRLKMRQSASLSGLLPQQDVDLFLDPGFVVRRVLAGRLVIPEQRQQDTVMAPMLLASLDVTSFTIYEN